MLSRKWRPISLAVALCFVLPHPCGAGPIKRPKFVICIPGELYFAPTLFPRSAPFLTLPRTPFHLNGFDLPHIIAPPEFQRPSPRIPSWVSDEPPPCRTFPPLPATMAGEYTRTP